MKGGSGAWLGGVPLDFRTTVYKLIIYVTIWFVAFYKYFTRCSPQLKHNTTNNVLTQLKSI